ncbi:MAG: PAS domain-containing protein [Arenicella sp.]
MLGKLDSVQETEKLTPEQIALFIKATNIGVWDWEIESKVLTCNKRWSEIIGYSLIELQPLSFETWSNFLHLTDIIKAKALLQEHW